MTTEQKLRNVFREIRQICRTIRRRRQPDFSFEWQCTEAEHEIACEIADLLEYTFKFDERY